MVKIRKVDLRKVANKLTLEKQLKVIEKLKEITNDLASGKFTYGDIAIRLSTQLDFSVGVSNLKSILTAAEIPFKNRGESKGLNSKIDTIYTRLAKRVEDLESSHIKIAQLVNNLESKITNFLEK